MFMKSKNEYKVEVGKAKFNESAMFIVEEAAYGAKELEVEVVRDAKNNMISDHETFSL